jgi:hypothetical protein
MPAVMLALILASSCNRSSTHARRLIDCHRYPNLEPAACEQKSDGSIVVSRQSLADIAFGPEGLGAIIVADRGLCFVNRQGKTAPAFHFDNGPDYVVEGMARTVKNGKVGFVNTQLDQVVAPVWDFASPFEHGVAEVCMGCVSTPVRPGDEHTYMAGGKWGYIDRRGKVIVPVVHDLRSLPPSEVAAKQAIR